MVNSVIKHAMDRRHSASVPKLGPNVRPLRSERVCFEAAAQVDREGLARCGAQTKQRVIRAGL